jgi:uncharacterized protein DUF6804
MFTKFMKWISVAGLLLGVFWGSENYRLVLELVVSVSAIMIFLQALKARKHAWVIVFTAIALLFNPVQPIGFSSAMDHGIELVSATVFLVSLVALRSKKRLSLQSITNPLPSTQAL